MTKMKLVLAASVLLGGIAFAEASSAAPMSPNGMQTSRSEVTQVRMMRGDRMMERRMMKRRMMRKRMMRRM